MTTKRTSYTHQRPAPRMAAGKTPNLNDLVTWTRTVSPPERYRLTYESSTSGRTERTIDLHKVGGYNGLTFFQVQQDGATKTLRADRITAVEQLSEGHSPSIEAQAGYHTRLPAFPLPNAVYRMQNSRGRTGRCWTVDLNGYTCTCPERRERAPRYSPGQLGFVCPHVARAVLDHLPNGADWPHDILAFLRDSRKVAIDNLL